MLMYKAYKFRIYPTDEQKIFINKTFGCSRYVYNYYLNKIKNDGYTSSYDNIKDYTNVLKYNSPFLQEIDSIVIRKSLFNLEDAFKRLFNKTGGYPKFKSKYNKNSYNTSLVTGIYKNKKYCNIELELPKLKWVKINLINIKNAQYFKNTVHFYAFLYVFCTMVVHFIVCPNIYGFAIYSINIKEIHLTQQ